MASTWPKVLNLSPAGPTVQMNELQDWMKRTQPVLMGVQPASGTDDHNFGQLVKSLRERNLVGPCRRCFPPGHPHARFEAVCLNGMGDPGHGPNHDEPSHCGIFGGPARCCVSGL